jgi:hypothetical protein
MLACTALSLNFVYMYIIVSSMASNLDFAGDDVIVLTLPSWYQRTSKVIDLRFIGRSVSKLLRTITRVLPEDWAADVAYRTGGSREPTWHRPRRTDHAAVKHVFLRLDNTQCSDRCFRDARHAAGFIALALRRGWDPGVQVQSVGGNIKFPQLQSNKPTAFFFQWPQRRINGTAKRTRTRDTQWTL